jgi:hypothetical protein
MIVAGAAKIGTAKMGTAKMARRNWCDAVTMPVHRRPIVRPFARDRPVRPCQIKPMAHIQAVKI